jgi:GTP-binding protein HflX
MVKKTAEPTIKPKERAFLVGVDIQKQENILSLEDSLSELSQLSDTAGLNVVGVATQRMNKPNPQTFIGSGKVEEIKVLADETQAEVLIFDEELSPRHLRELEKILGENIRVIDRTALILDIFAQHANTREGSLQVELAQYEYRLPRLTRAWTHLARQVGGGGGRSGSTGGVGLRGPGETQLEVDRREIRRRIDHLKDELEKVRIHRQQYRSRRKKSRIPIVALVGYTNAGKSTLLNQLTGAGVYVADQLFATLDPTTRRVELPGGHLALFTDTVGFVQKLPTTLVAAFKATLEEITEADILLHVVDITHPNVHSQVLAVFQVLEEIGASFIPMVTALNKIDLLNDPSKAREALEMYDHSLAISALNGEGMDQLLSKISELLFENLIKINVFLPYDQGSLISLFHESGRVDKYENVRGGVIIQGRIPGRFIARYQPYIKQDGT